MNEVLEYVSNGLTTEEWVVIGLGAYELVVRRKKTKKDWSLLSLIGKIFKNKNKKGGTHGK